MYKKQKPIPSQMSSTFNNDYNLFLWIQFQIKYPIINVYCDRCKKYHRQVQGEISLPSFGYVKFIQGQGSGVGSNQK